MDDEFDDILLDNYNIDTPNENQPKTANADDSNDETETTTGTRRVPKQKFDATLLLEPRGIPLLKTESQYLKFSKRKGHEDLDLMKLMTYYTIWANSLYPGLRIKDFSRRVTIPAKNKTITSMMDVWSKEYRDRRKVRLDVQNELSGKTVGDEDGTDENPPVPADDESSEDDNRQLFFPITNTNTSSAVNAQKKKSKPKSKPKSQKMAKPRTKAVIDTDDEEDDDADEQPLFTPLQQQQKRSIVLDDSSDEEDTYQLSRSNALALIVERKRKREQAQRAEQERLPPTAATTATSRTIIEDYDDVDEPAAFENQDNELLSLGLPSATSLDTTATDLKGTEEEEEFSDNELFDIKEA